VHPSYKTETHVRNWPEYERGLRGRGNITVWFGDDALANWISKSSGSPGGPRLYSDLAIETSLTLRTVFGLPLRQTEGFVESLLRMLGLDHLPVPDHTTLSRRAQSLKVAHRMTTLVGPIHLIVDSTGLQVTGNGPWAAAKHGTKGTREWRKLHIGVDERSFIVAQNLTESTVDEASIVPELLQQTRSPVDRFTADGAYDTAAVYNALAARGARVVIPPVKNARLSAKDTAATRARNATVKAVRELGRRRWKKQTGYHQQARVENTFFRYKQLIGGRLRSRGLAAQEAEVSIAINILNHMLDLGSPQSEPIRD
jgi:hypothetical protein